MIKAQIISDLHLDSKPYRYAQPAKGADIVILAGDVASWMGEGPQRFREFVTEAARGRHVLFVPGNHDHYGSDIEESLQRYRDLQIKIPGFHILDCESLSCCGLRIAGATLWTNFSLGNDSNGGYRAEAMVSDFTHIKDNGTTMTWRNMAKRSEKALAFLATEAPKSDLIVTHFLPSPRSIHEKYRNHPLNSYFCSDLTETLSRCNGLWVHGHTHDSANYTINTCQVVCNPRGYRDENCLFMGDLIAPIRINPQ